MIELNYGDKKYTLKNEPSEMSLNLFQDVVNLFSTDSNYFFETWLDIIGLLGSEELKEVIDDESFYKVILNLNLVNKISDAPTNIFTYNNREFSCKLKDNGELFITALEMSKIEKIVKKHPNNWITKAMAVLFKEEGVTETDSNINKRAALFGDKMTADIAMPLLSKVNIKLVDNIKRLQKMYEEEA